MDIPIIPSDSVVDNASLCLTWRAPCGCHIALVDRLNGPMTIGDTETLQLFMDGAAPKLIAAAKRFEERHDCQRALA